MADYSVADIDEELRRRGVATFPSVMAEEGTVGQEALKLAEAAAKGGTMGIINLLGGWGSYLDWRKKAYQGKDEPPSALSGAGIANFVKDKTGIDLQNVPGYKGAYETMQMAAPAMLLRGVAPEMSLFGPAATTRGAVTKTVGEGAVGAATGLAAESIAPDSPLAQLAIGMSPYAAKGAVMGIQNRLLRPTGTFDQSSAALLDVGRMTPGEFTGSRTQLAAEAIAEQSPKIEAKGTGFRQAQAQDAEGFISNLFNRASSLAIADPKEAASKLTESFKNFGRSLSTNLRNQASKDFKAAENSGGMVDTAPVVDKLTEIKNGLRPDLNPADGVLASRIDRILESLVRPAVPEQRIPSTIVSETGVPVATQVIPEVPAGTNQISIKDLKRAISGWSEAAWSGKYALNGADVFEGLAPGQSKGTARAVLRGFKDALDKAIDEGIPGADKLKQARDNFASNIQKIDTFAEMPLTKAFGKDYHTIVPEDLVKKLMDQKPTQRELLFGLLQEQSPEIADTIRKLQFDKMLSASQAKAPAANQPTFVVGEMLKQLNNKKGDFAFLFPEAKDLADVNKAMQWMSKVLQSEGAAASSGIRGDIYAASRGIGAGSQEANFAKAMYDSIKGLFAQPNAVANVVFDPNTVKNILDYQKKPTLQKGIDLLQSLPKPVAVGAARAGYMIGNQPIPNVEVTGSSADMPYSMEEIEAELARRQ